MPSKEKKLAKLEAAKAKEITKKLEEDMSNLTIISLLVATLSYLRMFGKAMTSNMFDIVKHRCLAYFQYPHPQISGIPPDSATGTFAKVFQHLVSKANAEHLSADAEHLSVDDPRFIFDEEGNWVPPDVDKDIISSDGVNIKLRRIILASKMGQYIASSNDRMSPIPHIIVGDYVYADVDYVMDNLPRDSELLQEDMTIAIEVRPVPKNDNLAEILADFINRSIPLNVGNYVKVIIDSTGIAKFVKFTTPIGTLSIAYPDAEYYVVVENKCISCGIKGVGTHQYGIGFICGLCKTIALHRVVDSIHTEADSIGSSCMGWASMTSLLSSCMEWESEEPIQTPRHEPIQTSSATTPSAATETTAPAILCIPVDSVDSRSYGSLASTLNDSTELAISNASQEFSALSSFSLLAQIIIGILVVTYPDIPIGQIAVCAYNRFCKIKDENIPYAYGGRIYRNYDKCDFITSGESGDNGWGWQQCRLCNEYYGEKERCTCIHKVKIDDIALFVEKVGNLRTLRTTNAVFSKCIEFVTNKRAAFEDSQAEWNDHTNCGSGCGTWKSGKANTVFTAIVLDGRGINFMHTPFSFNAIDPIFQKYFRDLSEMGASEKFKDRWSEGTILRIVDHVSTYLLR